MRFLAEYAGCCVLDAEQGFSKDSLGMIAVMRFWWCRDEGPVAVFDEPGSMELSK